MSRAELTGTPRTRNCVACAGASFEARDELRKSWKRADLESVSVPRRAPRLAAVEVRCLVRLRCAAVGWLGGWMVGWLAQSRGRRAWTRRGGGSSAGAQVHFQARSPAALQPLMCETARRSRGRRAGQGPRGALSRRTMGTAREAASGSMVGPAATANDRCRDCRR